MHMEAKEGKNTISRHKTQHTLSTAFHFRSPNPEKRTQKPLERENKCAFQVEQGLAAGLLSDNPLEGNRVFRPEPNGVHAGWLIPDVQHFG
jgi:hypothetical protein